MDPDMVSWQIYKEKISYLYDAVSHDMEEEIKIITKKLELLKETKREFDATFLTLVPGTEQIFESKVEEFIDKEKKHTHQLKWMERFKAETVIHKDGIITLHNVLLLKDFNRFDKDLRAGKVILSISLDFYRGTFDMFKDPVTRISGEISVNFKDYHRHPFVIIKK